MHYGAVASVAQLVELLICNQWVGGSSPSAGSRKLDVLILVGFPSGQREQTVNLSAKPSEVRILPPPPTLAESIVGDFGLTLGIDSNYMTSCMKLVSVLWDQV